MKKILKNCKRAIAFLLVICIVISNFNITATEVLAEEPEKNQYTVVCKIKETNKEISDSEVKIEIFDRDNNEIKKTGNTYELEKGEDYKYKVTSTSSKFKGLPLEIRDTITAGTDKEIPLFIPLDKLNIEMGNKECYKGGSISMFAADDWNLGWEWTSNNDKVAKVDNQGNVTGIGEGTATITKTSRFNSEITASTEVRVTTRKVNCGLSFVIKKDAENKEKIELDKLSVRDGDSEISISEGKYSLIPGKEYNYKIEDVGITDKTKEGTFIAPDYKDDNVENIFIPLELVEPDLRINDNLIIGNIKEMKKGSKVTLQCINYDSLYQKASWEFKINGENKDLSVKQSLEVDSETESSDEFQISYECSKNSSVNYIEKETKISIFENYKFITLYDGDRIDLAPKYITIQDKDDDDKFVEPEKMRDGGHYKIIVSGFNENTTDNVIPTFTNQEIFVTSGDIILPEFQNVEGYCGEKISLKSKGKVVTNLYYEPWNWNWNCVKEDDPNKILVVDKEKNEIDLSTAETGTYKLTCSYKGIEKSATITVNKIRLQVDWREWEKQWNPEPMAYNTSNSYQIKLYIKDSYVYVDGKNEKQEKDNYSIDKDCLVITGELGLGNIGYYKELNNVQIEIDGTPNKEKYDLSEIEKELEKGTLTFDDKEIVIQPDTLHISFEKGAIPLQRRSRMLAYEEKDIILESDSYGTIKGDRKISLLKIISDLMKDAEILKENNSKCIFQEVKKDENFNGNAYICDSNINVIFDDSWEENKQRVEFTYEDKPDSLYLSLEEILKKCNFTQKNKDKEEIELSNNSFCLYNNEEGSCKIKAEFKDAQYKNDYNKITFKKLEATSWDALSSSNIESGSEETIPGIKTTGKEEEYYQVIFGDEYATTAAIIRILPEEQYRLDYPNSFSAIGKGGDYPVINLFFDDTAPEIHFEEADLERQDVEQVRGGEKHYNKIDFDIKNTGFDVASVQYGFCNLNSEADFVSKEAVMNEMESQRLNDYDLNKKPYAVDCPSTEGDYALYIKTKDKGGNEGIYISNGFFVDRTKPDIDSKFTKEKSKEDLTTKIKDEKTKVYSNEGIHAEFTLIEPHLKPETVKVTITAVDGNGKKISRLDQYVKDKETEIITNLSQERQKERIAKCEFTESANYTVTITAEDKAGQSPDEPFTYHFTVDTEKPKGSVSATGRYHKIESGEGREKGKVTLVAEKLEAVWDKLTEAIYKIFSQEEIKVTLIGNDEISPVDIYYYDTTKELKEDQLEDITNWTTYSPEKGKKPKLTINKWEIVYGKVVDKAGNVSYFCTDGMITDNEPPKVDSPVIGKAANKNGFYNSDIPFSVNIEDKIAEGGTASSGLQYVSYRIEKEGSILESEVKYDVKDKPVILKGVISAEKFNNNDVTLYVTAVDNAGNMSKKEPINFKIDTMKPEISVTYDGDSGTKYCNRVRTATITIKERNLDTKDVDISIKSNRGSKASIGTWSHSSDIGKSDDATYTCQVVFSEDDEYQFAVSCVDKAGNKAVNNFTDEFTIDTTKPVIAVNYNKEILSQDTYFNEPVTATITITERNFDAGKVNIQNNAGTSGGTIPGVTGFSSNGDTHTATIQYNTDGRYGLSIEYTDEAGNQADSYTGNNFTIDLTEPEIKITNIENRSANKDKVQPVITCTDANYDVEQVSVTVTGSNSGEVELKNLGYAASNIADGQQFTMDFPKTEELDDVYTLTAKIKDKAGNEKESSIDFSVNRYGSVYTLATETGEWLTNNECAYIKEGKPVVILETNVDEITDQNISYMMGGMGASIVNIKESAECSPEEKENGSYFTASKVDTNGQWHQSKYEIHANNFTKEGRYTIQIDSTDRAGNHTSNVSNKHNGGNLQIEFAVDQTAPSVVVTGADSGDIYNEETHTVLLDVQDNLAMDYVTVYLNGKEYGTYKEEDIEKMENGFIPVNIKESISTQKIQVKAMDMAGNILGKDVNGAYDKSFDDFKILVTRNPFVRILHKTWLLLIILLIVLCGIGVFIVVKRKKKQD